MRQAGFTLLELLVALTVLGFILAGLAGGARFGLQAVESQSRLSESRSDLDAVDRTLRRIIAEADPQSRLRGTSGTMALVSRLPAGPGLAPQQSDVGLGLDDRHRLILRWSRHFSGQLFGPAPAPKEEVLITGLRGIDLSYWSSAGAGAWSSEWGQTSLPALIRLRLIFPQDDARRWPDIVVAPMRQTLSVSNAQASSPARSTP